MSPSKRKPMKATVPAVNISAEPPEKTLLVRSVDIIHATHQHITRPVNVAMVQDYWPVLIRAGLSTRL